MKILTSVLLATVAYRDGEYEGLHSHYHKNGQLSHALRYQAGQPADGKYRSFDEHGLERNWAEDGTRTVCAWQDGSLLRACRNF